MKFQEQHPNEVQVDCTNNRKKWLKRLGIAGFLFFTIKGLVWIGIALFAWKGCAS